LGKIFAAQNFPPAPPPWQVGGVGIFQPKVGVWKNPAPPTRGPPPGKRPPPQKGPLKGPRPRSHPPFFFGLFGPKTLPKGGAFFPGEKAFLFLGFGPLFSLLGEEHEKRLPAAPAQAKPPLPPGPPPGPPLGGGGPKTAHRLGKFSFYVFAPPGIQPPGICPVFFFEPTPKSPGEKKPGPWGFSPPTLQILAGDPPPPFGQFFGGWATPPLALLPPTPGLPWGGKKRNPLKKAKAEFGPPP